MTEKRNVRFWVSGREGWVKLTLRPGQVLEHGWSEPTEEGYSFAYDEWYYDANYNVVRREHTSGGRDCDGRLEHTRNSMCPVHQLAWTPIVQYVRGIDGDEYPAPLLHDARPMFQPDWIHEPTRVYDEYAQAAGY